MPSGKNLQSGNGEYLDETFKSAILTRTQESSENSSSSSTVHRKGEKPIEIDGGGKIHSVACLADGKHIVSGGSQGKIRCWRVADGKGVGTPMDAGSAVCNIAVSRDGKWIVSGTQSGQVKVWDAENHENVSEFNGHSDLVRAVDVSPDGTRIATGSDDMTVCIWSLSTGQPLLGPLKHDYCVVTTKFSPDGHLLATATWWCESVRIHDSLNGRLLVDVPIKVDSLFNHSLAWASSNKHLFALSRDGSINCLDVSTGRTLSQWPIHSNNNPTCITVASNDTFIAASANSSVSFWDTTTHKQIGSVIQHTADIECIAISTNYDIVISGGRTITLRNIYGSYYDDTFLEQLIRHIKVEKAVLDETIQSLHIKNARLEETVQEFCTELTDFRFFEQKAGSLVQLLHAHEQNHQCEALYAKDRIIDAAVSLLEIANTVTGDVGANKLLTDWLTEFTSRCISKPERIGDEATNSKKYDEALAAYSIALSLGPLTPNTILIKWAHTILIRGSANEALGAAAKFKVSRFDIYRAICDVLEGDNRVTEAVECFQQMEGELGEDVSTHGERAQWELDFRERCVKKLEKLGDIAMGS